MHVKDVSEATFPHEVGSRSAEVPVVVDFWAPWCGPCRTLGPLLEREVEAMGGRVELAKLDTDANPRLAAEFAIQSIPAVKAFRNGVVVDEFVGLRSAEFIRSFLQRLAPPPGVVALKAAATAARAGDRAGAVFLLRPLLDDAAMGAEAAFHLAHLLLDGEDADLAEVERLLARVDPDGPLGDRVENARRLARLHAEARASGGAQAAEEAVRADDKNLDARHTLATLAAAAGRWEEALARFLEVVTRRAKHRDGAAQKAMLAIFDHLGNDHSLTRDYRRKLQIVT